MVTLTCFALVSQLRQLLTCGWHQMCDYEVFTSVQGAACGLPAFVEPSIIRCISIKSTPRYISTQTYYTRGSWGKKQVMLPTSCVPLSLYPPLWEPQLATYWLSTNAFSFNRRKRRHTDWRVHNITGEYQRMRALHREKPVVSSRYVCGGFCRRTRSPHFFAALSNLRMHSIRHRCYVNHPLSSTSRRFLLASSLDLDP